MSRNSLKLNEEKTEVTVFSKTSSLSQPIKIGSAIVNSSSTLRILGVYFDQTLSMDQQISNTCRSGYMHLRKINSIRKFLTESAVKTLVNQTVTSRLDYCNSLYVGLPKKSVRRLQIVQNSAARLITKTPRREHISGELRRLHWLPIISRCQFKVLLITYKILHGSSPDYLCQLIDWYTPARPLRSAATPSLVPRRNNSVKYGRRKLDTAAATLWNGLPDNIRRSTSVVVFKKSLKTHLFVMW